MYFVIELLLLTDNINNDDEWNPIEYVVVIKNLQGEPVNLEPQFCERLEWIPLDNLPKNITPYARIAIENFVNGVYFAEINS